MILLSEKTNILKLNKHSEVMTPEGKVKNITFNPEDFEVINIDIEIKKQNLFSIIIK